MFITSNYDTDTSTKLNLQRLFIFRSVGIVCQALVIAVVVQWLNMPLSLLPLTIILSALAIWNLMSWWRMQHSWLILNWEFFIQLIVDVIALTGVLYFAGGATNPFAWFFLLPLMIAATVLTKGFVWIMAGLTVACYSLLMFYFMPLSPAEMGMHMEMEMSHGDGFQMHVFGMWFGFVLSAGLVAYFITGMACTLREHAQVLARAREQALRDERLVALGTLAAGAAHELGTPLGTMAIVTGELEQEYTAANNPDLNEKLGIIKSQITRCKKALSTISASAGEIRAESGKLVSVENYLEQISEDWRQHRIGVNLQCHLQGPRPSPQIVAENVLNQALNNILDNAADASPDNVELKASWDANELVIEINDYGSGLSAIASESAGKDPFTTKKQGLGLGLFLAHASIERLGGSITLFNREEGGVCTLIILPLSPLVAKT